METKMAKNKMSSCCEMVAPITRALLRIFVGIIFTYAGYMKIQNPEMVSGMLHSMNFPAPVFMAWLLIISELVGGLCLILGLFTKIASIPLIIVMLVAFFVVHLPSGFVGQPGMATWYVLLILLNLLYLATNCSKDYSLDALICKNKK